VHDVGKPTALINNTTDLDRGKVSECVGGGAAQDRRHLKHYMRRQLVTTFGMSHCMYVGSIRAHIFGKADNSIVTNMTPNMTQELPQTTRHTPA
jgi:hypothetical protein